MAQRGDEAPGSVGPIHPAATAGFRDQQRSPPSSPLLPDVGVIALVPDAWDDFWQSRHYVLTRLARYFQVVWCNPPGSEMDGHPPGTNHDVARDAVPGFM